MVQVPLVEAEEQRPLLWDLATLKQDRARTTTRLKGLRRSQGETADAPDQGAQTPRGAAVVGWVTASAGPASALVHLTHDGS